MNAALKDFDRKSVLPAWDAMVKKQQQVMENLGVPTMFPTTSVADRTRQQRLMRVIQSGLEEGAT